MGKKNCMGDILTGNIKGHFLDSGSFSLKTQAMTYHKENGGGIFDFYDTDIFWKYMDNYATFIRRYKIAIDHYANVDVIPNPVLSWRNQRYLETKWGLSPVPVIHYGTDMKWIRRHVEKYNFIALGGLVGNTAGTTSDDWLCDCFRIICNTPNKTPSVRVHGFGVTKHRLLFKFPWYSVDSTSWTKIGAYGEVIIPKRRNGKFRMDSTPYVIQFSHESKRVKDKGAHYYTLTRAEKKIVCMWLASLGIDIGSEETGEKPEEKGVITDHNDRRRANLLYFEELRKSIPKYPWAFNAPRKVGFL